MTLLVYSTDALKTCWSQDKCVDVYSTKFYQGNDDSVELNSAATKEASNLLKYVQGTPAIEITNKSDLPQIQLIGDFSGVDDDELAVVLAFEPNNYIFVANTSILDMDLDHGVKISKAYC